MLRDTKSEVIWLADIKRSLFDYCALWFMTNLLKDTAPIKVIFFSRVGERITAK